MLHTQEQKNTLRTTWIPSAIITSLYLIAIYWTKKDDEGYSHRVLQDYMRYIYLFTIWLAWSWDWIASKDYTRAGILLAATVGVWALLKYVIKEDGNEYDITASYVLKVVFLLSPTLWVAVARAIIDQHPIKSGAALLTAFTVIILNKISGNAQFGMIMFSIPFLVLMQYVFGLEWMVDFLNGRTAFDLSSALNVAIDVMVVQWTYQLFCNLLDPEKRPAVKVIFGTSFPKVSGRYFAFVFPMLYIVMAAAATSVIVYIAQLYTRDISQLMVDFESYRLGRSFTYLGQNKLLLICLIGICIFLTVASFRLLRTLVLCRCITLRKKIGFPYLLSFVPFLNIFSWLYLSLTQSSADENMRLEYAAEMNDPVKQRSTGTINFLITLTILYTLLNIISDVNRGGLLAVFFAIIYVMVYIGFVYRPQMLYWIIAIKVLLLLLILFTDRLAPGIKMLVATYSFYGVLMLFWQMKIFHPDIEMPLELRFDGEAEAEDENILKDSEPPFSGQ